MSTQPCMQHFTSVKVRVLASKIIFNVLFMQNCAFQNNVACCCMSYLSCYVILFIELHQLLEKKMICCQYVENHVNHFNAYSIPQKSQLLKCVDTMVFFVFFDSESLGYLLLKSKSKTFIPWKLR